MTQRLWQTFLKWNMSKKQHLLLHHAILSVYSITISVIVMSVFIALLKHHYLQQMSISLSQNAISIINARLEIMASQTGSRLRLVSKGIQILTQDLSMSLDVERFTATLLTNRAIHDWVKHLKRGLNLLKVCWITSPLR